jgi:inhibitor of KinA sporulation pathway (predicted exonuclease)
VSTFVVFDLEYTTWPGAVEGNWSAPGQLREIVQIGALRLNEEYEVVAAYEALVRPVANPELSPYFTELTGIDQESVDRDGLPPARALDAFLGFCAREAVLSYGNDMTVLAENAAWAGVRGEQLGNSLLTPAFLNIRPWLNAHAPGTSGVNSGRLWQALGLPGPTVPGGEHSALFDCHSLAAAIGHVCGKGARLPEGCV